MLIAKNTFIQMSKLSNVKGRISYISSHAKQENLYAVYETVDRSFWTKLANCNQEEFRKSGTDGQCIEARELIIALPKSLEQFDPQLVLENMTNAMKERYGVECISALHHNKRKTNYHIHLIFSERKILAEPEVKIATRNMFYDQRGKRVRTKKEILDEDGNVKEGCKIVGKGEVYEWNEFTKKDPKYKSKEFLDEIKVFYINEINPVVMDDEEKLKVFDRKIPYLATKKIGKNNPREEQIRRDNVVREVWNQTVDEGYAVGVSKEIMLQVKQEHVIERLKNTMHRHKYIPRLFNQIIGQAVNVLVKIVYKAWLDKREQAIAKAEGIPPKQTELVSAIGVLNELQDTLMIKKKEEVSCKSKINELQEELKQKQGIFQGGARKKLEAAIHMQEQLLVENKKEVKMLLKASGYKSVEAFQKEYLQAKREVKDYRGELELYQEVRNQKIEILLQEVGDEPKSFLEKLQPYVHAKKLKDKEKRRTKVERER